MSIDKLPSGRWRVRLMSGTHGDGRPRRVSRLLPEGASKADAKRTEARLRLELGQSTGEADIQTVLEMVEAWIASDTRRAPATNYKYRGIAGKWIDGHPIADMAISRVRAGDIERHIESILSYDPPTSRTKGKKVGPDTVQQVAAILSGSFKRAVRLGWISASPCVALRPVEKRGRSAIRAADPAEFRQALAKAENVQPGLKAYIRFLGSTGCRRAEALALRWDSIDGRTVNLAESVSVVPGVGLTIKPTKTGRARRITIDQGLLDMLEERRRLQHKTCDAAGIEHRGDMFVWSQDGLGDKPWRPDTAGKWVRATGVTPLMLRHMVPTQLLAAGHPLGAVSKRLGHTRISTTLDVYSESIPADDQRAADAMTDLLGL